MSRSSEDKELESSLKRVLKSIPPEYKDFRNFSHIAQVAKALKKDPQKCLKELNAHYNSLNGAVSEIVNVNYAGFNKSIKNFSDILNNLENSQKKIQTLEAEIDRCKELLASRANDLAQLYANYLQHTEFLNILNQVEEVKSIPEQLQHAIETKHYLYAVNMILKYAEVLKKDQLKSIKALHQIRQDLEKNRQKLPDILADELNSYVYNGSIASSITLGEVLASQKEKHEPLRRSRRRPSQRSLIHQQITASNVNISDDLNVDVQSDPHFFMTMIIEALDKLGQLPDVQSRLIQSLRFELRSLMDTHIAQFVQSLETSDREILWTIIQNQNNSELPGVNKATIQGQLLVEMLQGLFNNLNGVLSNFRFVIEVIGVKLGRTEEGAQVDSSLNIKLTKEVLARLKGSVRNKLDELRNNKKSEVLYINSLETFLFNFIEREKTAENESQMRVKDIPDVFADIVRTEAAIKQSDSSLSEKKMKEINSEFVLLLTDSISSSDTPRLLTTEHVWKTIQDELKVILRDLLGAMADDIITGEKKRNSTGTPGVTTKDAPVKGLRFRFGTNFEVHSITTDEPMEKKETGASIFSATTKPLMTYFTFTPYNMIWMFRLVRDFINMSNGTMSEANTNDSLLSEFMSDAVKQSLMPKVRSDYRGKLSRLFKEPDAFRPQEFIYTKTNPQYEKDLRLRPLLHSSIQLSRWLEELYQLAAAIPPYRNDFCEIMELLLKRYLEECKSQFRSTIDGKYVGECILRGDIISILESDPAWLRIGDEILATKIKKVEKEEYDMKMNQVVDKTILDLMTSQTDRNSYNLLINNVSSLILLANLNDSLEWVAEQITGISRWAADNNPSNNTQPDKDTKMSQLTPVPHGRRQSVMNTFKKMQKHQQHVASIGSGSSFVLRSLEEYHKKFKQLASWCLFALKVDIRAHVFHFLKIPLIKSSYECEDESTEPETFVSNFNGDVARIDKALSIYLPKEKKQYLFEGLGRLVANLLIDSLQIMQSKRFNTRGIHKMNRNIFSIQQNITNIIESRENSFNRVRQYYSMLELSEKEFFNAISSLEHGQLFSQAQYEAILECILERDQMGSDDIVNKEELLKKKKITLKEIYAEAEQEAKQEVKK